MADLTQRQIKILKSIVEEFIETAAPVGSETLEKKFSLGVSSATIRNEMGSLTDAGYLKKSHLSSGRAPTSMGLKYYIRNLMTPRVLSVSEEIGTKEKIWDYRNEFEKLVKEATKELAIRTRSMGICTTDQGSIYYYGASNLLEEPEFFNIDVAKTVLSLIDNVSYWFDIVAKVNHNDVDDRFIHLLIGEDLGMEHLEPCGFIYQRYEAGPHRGIVGVIGPARAHYQNVIPLVDYIAGLIGSITR
jgi:transcriptional regulator of heat shock response